MALRVAVIGLRGTGRNHSRIYVEHPQAELVGVCALVCERVDAAPAPLFVSAFSDTGPMLAGLHRAAVSAATVGVENGGDHRAPPPAAQAGDQDPGQGTPAFQRKLDLLDPTPDIDGGSGGRA